MTIYTLDYFARQGAIAGIRAYRHHLSPRKGFACPHRVLYQQESCSDYVQQLLEQHSLLAAVRMAPQRFQACHQAALALQASGQTRQEGSCIVIPCCIPI